MALQNSINNKSSQITIDPGASGDSFVQFDINTTGEFRIGVDDTDDSFRISQGSALGTNDTFIMSAAGERTMPLQPAFMAYLASDDDDVTGNGTTYTLGTNTALTEVFDQNGDFNTNGTFTAPVSGRYVFYFWLQIHDIGAATGTWMEIITSNRGYHTNEYNPTSIDNTSEQLSANFSILADMDASDTTTFQFMVSGLGSDTIDINGSSTLSTGMSGYMAC